MQLQQQQQQQQQQQNAAAASEAQGPTQLVPTPPVIPPSQLAVPLSAIPPFTAIGKSNDDVVHKKKKRKREKQSELCFSLFLFFFFCEQNQLRSMLIFTRSRRGHRTLYCRSCSL